MGVKREMSVAFFALGVACAARCACSPRSACSMSAGWLLPPPMRRSRRTFAGVAHDAHNPSTMHIVLVLLAAGCWCNRRLVPGASARSSSRPMLELQRIAVVDSSCTRRLQLVYSSSIDLLNFGPMLHGRQQELLRVFGSVKEPVEMALQRGLNGRVRRRLRRARRVMCSAGHTRNERACMRMPAHTPARPLARQNTNAAL